MPIYEFYCQNCNTKSNILVRNIAEPHAAKCSVCGSNDLVRVISSFAYHKSTSTVWEESGEPQFSPKPDYYKDPRNIGRWAEKRFSDLGVDMPTEIKEEIQACREGELPSSLKEQL